MRILATGLLAALFSLPLVSKTNTLADPPNPGLKAEEEKKEPKKSILEIYKPCIENYSSNRFAVWNNNGTEKLTQLVSKLSEEKKYKELAELISLIDKELDRLASIKDPYERTRIFQLERSLQTAVGGVPAGVFVNLLSVNNSPHKGAVVKTVLKLYPSKEKQGKMQKDTEYAKLSLFTHALQSDYEILSPQYIEAIALEHPHKTMELIRCPSVRRGALKVLSSSPHPQIREIAQEEMNYRQSDDP